MKAIQQASILQSVFWSEVITSKGQFWMWTHVAVYMRPALWIFEVDFHRDISSNKTSIFKFPCILACLEYLSCNSVMSTIVKLRITGPPSYIVKIQVIFLIVPMTALYLNYWYWIIVRCSELLPLKMYYLPRYRLNYLVIKVSTWRICEMLGVFLSDDIRQAMSTGASRPLQTSSSLMVIEMQRYTDAKILPSDKYRLDLYS